MVHFRLKGTDSAELGLFARATLLADHVNTSDPLQPALIRK